MATTTLAGSLTLGAGSVSDEQINSNADIGVAKMRHAYTKQTNFDLPIGGTPATREEIVHLATAAGTFRSFKAALNDTGTSTAITFDLKKNGVSVLSAAISFTEADADRSVKAGTITTTTFAAGDIISILMTVSSATGATGPIATAGIAENEAP